MGVAAKGRCRCRWSPLSPRHLPPTSLPARPPDGPAVNAKGRATANPDQLPTHRGHSLGGGLGLGLGVASAAHVGHGLGHGSGGGGGGIRGGLGRGRCAGGGRCLQIPPDTEQSLWEQEIGCRLCRMDASRPAARGRARSGGASSASGSYALPALPCNPCKGPMSQST